MIKPKFRVDERIHGSGKSKFYPQERKFFMWWDFDNSNVSSNNWVWYGSLLEAENFLDKTYKDRMGNQVIKTEKHPFNAVFHALKNE